jgi:hypothetical protein
MLKLIYSFSIIRTLIFQNTWNPKKNVSLDSLQLDNQKSYKYRERKIIIRYIIEVKQEIQ